MKYLNLIYNPFEKLSERTAIIVGLLAIPITSYLCLLAGGMFSDFCNFSGGAQNISYWQILIVNFAICLLSAQVFYFLGKLFSKSKVRIIDVFGYIFFALIPMIFVPLFFIPKASNVFLSPPNPISQEWIAQNWTLLAGVLVCSSILPMIWCWVLLFNAVKISANLRGARLWICYILGIIIITATMRLLVFPAVVFNLSSFNVPAKSEYVSLSPSASMLGMYEGKLKFPGQTLRFRLFIDNDGKLNVYATSPDQGDSKILIENFDFADSRLTFSIPPLDVKFVGGFTNPNGDTIEGVFTQHGYSVPLTLKKIKDFYYSASIEATIPLVGKNASDIAKLLFDKEFMRCVAMRLNGDVLKVLKAFYPSTNVEDALLQSKNVKIDLGEKESKITITFTSKFAGIAQNVAYEMARELVSKTDLPQTKSKFEISSKKIPLKKTLVDITKNL